MGGCIVPARSELGAYACHKRAEVRGRVQAASSRVPLGRCELGAGTSEVRVCGFLLASGWPVVEVERTAAC